MSSERFDKILKKNLESVRPAYQPHAWNRFSKRLPATGFLPWFQQFGGWALAAMMMAGWLTTLYTLRTNQALLRDLNTGSKQALLQLTAPENNNNQPQKNAADKTLLSHSPQDTVYVVKKTIIEHRHFYNADRLASTGLRNNQPGSHLEKNQNIPDGQTPPKRQAINVSNSENDNLPQITGNQILHKTADTSTVVAENVSMSPTVEDTGRIASDDNETFGLLDSNRAVQTYSYKTLAALVDSISSKKALTSPVRPKRPPFRLSSLQPRLGMESLLSLHGYGIGPVVELFPMENLGVSLGIQASTLEAENHKALRDYNSATGKFFLIQYRDYLPHRFDRIEDISIKTTVISLPISLKYYIPLQKNLSLFVQSGTSLDLSAYQEVDFESYLNKSKRRNTFETDAKPNFFHNFMFGAGVQYKRSRILAQLSPYVVYDFRNIENTPAGSNLGLRASLWLNLFK